MSKRDLPDLQEDSQPTTGMRRRTSAKGDVTNSRTAASDDGLHRKSAAKDAARDEAMEEGAADEGGGRKEGKETITHKLVVRDAGLKQVVKRMAMLTLQTRQEVDFLAGATSMTFMLNIDSNLHEKVTEAGQKYAATCTSKGRGHDLGPPTIWLWKAMIDALSSEDVGGTNHKELERHKSELEAAARDAIIQRVRVARVGNVDQSNMKRLQLILVDEPPEFEGGEGEQPLTIKKSLVKLLLLIKDCMRQLGVVEKSGKPPAGYMERELREWVKLLAD